MTLLENALSSIEVALEDFSSKEKARLIAAVRNLHCGILLLFKEKLRRLSPVGSEDVLIKQRILPRRLANGTIVFVGDGKKTVDVSQIKERFGSMGIRVEWKRFEEINKFRNSIEHYFTPSQRDAIRGLIANAFSVIRDFLADELNIDPKSALGEAAWNTLISESEVFEKELADCQKKISSVEWESDDLSLAVKEVKCVSCESRLVVPAGPLRTDGVECRSCNEVEIFEDFAERALIEYLEGRNHNSLRESGEEVLIQCPFCFLSGYVVDEKKCAICGESCTHTCELCASDIPSCELSDGELCSYCSNSVNKDD